MKLNAILYFAAAISAPLLLSFCTKTTAPSVAPLQGDTITVETSRLATPMKVSVILPAQALEKGSTERFPVVYLLNGYSGHYASWPELVPEIDSLATHYGMIFVCPDGRDSWYWDSPVDSGMQMESFIIEELVPRIDSLYPTIPSPAARAVSGLSMGGHGAMWLGLRHPDVFGSMGSMSGGLDIRPFPENWLMSERLGTIEAAPEEWESHTVINIIPDADPAAGQHITIDCGVDDFFAGVNEAAHKALLERGIHHDYTVRPGAHSGPYWHNSLFYHLLFFDRAFRENNVR
ncbi:MAG: esterase family protein [Muribaculaceae bacterium]|nr:esterase family protein [Muribaculaceae bacterium]